MPLSPDSPLVVRLLAWANERFPPGPGVMFVALYLGALVTGRAFTHGPPLELGALDVVSFFGVWAFFLMLRVFDEHKDYALDLQNYPQRVLQSGLITLGHLKVACGVAIALQLGVSLAHDHGFGLVTRWWLLTFGWSLLMAKEFFIGEWLAKRLVLYATSHMLVMPMSLLWMAQMGAGQTALPGSVVALAIMSFCAGASFEVTRKIKAPVDERPTVDSYTKVLGTTGAPIVTMFMLLSASAAELWLLRDLGVWSTTGVAVVVGGWLLASAVLLRFASVKTTKAAKAGEAAVGLTMIGAYVVLIASVMAQRGVSWI
jgi:hypothetical protein